MKRRLPARLHAGNHSGGDSAEFRYIYISAPSPLLRSRISVPVFYHESGESEGGVHKRPFFWKRKVNRSGEWTLGPSAHQPRENGTWVLPLTSRE